MEMEQGPGGKPDGEGRREGITGRRRDGGRRRRKSSGGPKRKTRRALPEHSDGIPIAARRPARVT